jgi:hypothetical protein
MVFLFDCLENLIRAWMLVSEIWKVDTFESLTLPFPEPVISACKVACEIPAQPTASTTAWTVVIFTEFGLHRER